MCQNGALEWKEFVHDIWQTRKSEIQIWEQKFLVQRVQRRHSRKYVRNQLQEDCWSDQITLKNIMTRLLVSWRRKAEKAAPKGAASEIVRLADYSRGRDRCL